MSHLEHLYNDLEESDINSFTSMHHPDGLINLNDTKELSLAVEAVRNRFQISKDSDIRQILLHFDRLDGVEDGIIHLETLLEFIAGFVIEGKTIDDLLEKIRAVKTA